MSRVQYKDLIIERNESKLKIFNEEGKLLHSFNIIGLNEKMVLAMVKAWLIGHKYDIKEKELKELLYPSEKIIEIPPTPEFEEAIPAIEEPKEVPTRARPVRKLEEEFKEFEMPRRKISELTDIKATAIGLDFEGIEIFLRKIVGLRASTTMTQVMLGVKIYEFPLKMILKGEIKEILVRFWLLSGYESHATNRQVMYRGSDFVFVFFDHSDRETFEMVPKYVSEAVTFGDCRWIILIGLRDRPYPGLKSWDIISSSDVLELKTNLFKQYHGSVRFDTYTLYKDQSDEMRKIIKDLIKMLVEE